MTLHEWLALQPVHPHVRNGDGDRVAWVSIPDVADLVDRPGAFHLSDATVTSCAGGSIYFVPRV